MTPTDPIREAIERAATRCHDSAGYYVNQTAVRRFENIITAELAPLVAERDARVRELESLLREARHDMHYLIRCVTSESTTDMEFTEHARIRFAGEIETYEKIVEALAGTNTGGTDG